MGCLVLLRSYLEEFAVSFRPRVLHSRAQLPLHHRAVLTDQFLGASLIQNVLAHGTGLVKAKVFMQFD